MLGFFNLLLKATRSLAITLGDLFVGILQFVSFVLWMKSVRFEKSPAFH